jgi:hypothetical protein
MTILNTTLDPQKLQELEAAQEALHQFSDNQGVGRYKKYAIDRFVKATLAVDPDEDEASTREIAKMLSGGDGENNQFTTSLDTSQEIIRKTSGDSYLEIENVASALQTDLTGEKVNKELPVSVSYLDKLNYLAENDRLNNFLGFFDYLEASKDTSLQYQQEVTREKCEGDIVTAAVIKTIIHGFNYTRFYLKKEHKADSYRLNVFGIVEAISPDEDENRQGERKPFPVEDYTVYSFSGYLQALFPELDIPDSARVKRLSWLLTEKLDPDEVVNIAFAGCVQLRSLVPAIMTLYGDIVRCTLFGRHKQPELKPSLPGDAGRPARGANIEDMRQRMLNVAGVITNYNHIAGGFGKRVADVAKLLKDAGYTSSKVGRKKHA